MKAFCDTCMVRVSFCQILLSQEEISKSAGEWVFCGMNQKCLETAIQKSMEKLNFSEIC